MNVFLLIQCLFAPALRHHVPSISDLFDCLDATEREHEILAWVVKNNTEQKGVLFTPLEKSEDDGKYKLGDIRNIEKLVEIYNGKLYTSEKQQARKLIIKNNHIFIKNYKDDTIAVIQKIKDLTSGGIQNYSNMVNHWLQNTDYQIDSEEKRAY